MSPHSLSLPVEMTPDLESALSHLNYTFTVSDNTLPDCPLVYASRGFLQLTGYSAEEILGHNCRFLQTHDTDAQTVLSLREAVLGGNQISVRLLLPLKNRTAHRHESRCARLTPYRVIMMQRANTCETRAPCIFPFDLSLMQQGPTGRLPLPGQR